MMEGTELGLHALVALMDGDAPTFIKERMDESKARLDFLDLSTEEGKQEALEIVRHIQAMRRILDDIEDWGHGAKALLEGN